MTRQTVTIALAVAGVLSANPAGAQMAPGAQPEWAGRVDAVFSTWDNTRSPGCALGISQNGRVVYTRGYGMSNLEYDVAISPESIFHVASISKQFTAFAVMLLAGDGKLALDDDIRRYVPEVPTYGPTITIRHLLTHTSGLRDQWALLWLAGWRDDDLITEDDVLKIVARQQALNFTPGAEYLYSNTGFTLGAVIVKRVSGQSLREFAEARIFAPLGMRDTHFHDDHTMIVRRRTSAYQPRTGGGLKVSIPVYDTCGATSLFTTVGDLLKWEENFVDARVGGRTLVDQLQTIGRLNANGPMEYALGLRVTPYRGLVTVGHDGADAGYRSDVVRFPDHHLAVTALCNLSSTNPGVLTRKVAEAVLGSSAFAPLPPNVPMAATELTALSGTYWNPLTDDVRQVVMQNGQISFKGDTDALVPIGGGRFRVGDQPNEVRFSTGSGGQTELQTTPPAPVPFVRVTAPTIAPGDLDAFAGDYRSEELDVEYTVMGAKAGTLTVTSRRGDPVDLQLVKKDTFVEPSFGTVTFERAAGGEVRGFTVSTGWVRRLAFRRLSARR